MPSPIRPLPNIVHVQGLRDYMNRQERQQVGRDCLELAVKCHPFLKILLVVRECLSSGQVHGLLVANVMELMCMGWILESALHM